MLALGALPDEATRLCNDSLIGQVISNVARHYNASAACLALETSTGMDIKAACGICTGKLPLSSITRHVPGRPLPIIIYDAKSDQRFVHDRFVQGPPYARFYVGAPIVIHAMDTCVGSLCLVDTVPRRAFGLCDCDALLAAAEKISNHLEECLLGAGSLEKRDLGDIYTSESTTAESVIGAAQDADGKCDTAALSAQELDHGEIISDAEWDYDDDESVQQLWPSHSESLPEHDITLPMRRESNQ